jgi:predicted acetyltransferase
MDLEIRAIRPDEIEELLVADERAFGSAPHTDDTARPWADAELGRTRVAFADGAMVGVSRAYTFELTMPGGTTLPAAAVSWVGVLPTHRRRGVLTQMMRALHDDARARDEPIAMLTASESLIYGRFGYGPAAWRVGLHAERARVTFRDPTASGSMRLITRDEAEKVLPALYETVQTTRAGMVSRPDFWWEGVFWGNWGRKDHAFFIAVHSNRAGDDDGYVAYKVEQDWTGGLTDGTLTVVEILATDAASRADLWRYVFGVDLVRTVEVMNTALDDPLRHLVADGRRIRVDYLNDALWVAPLDPAVALAARTYATTDALVIEVHAPDGRATRLALDGGRDGATCTSTDAAPDIVCPSATLGACLLGGTRWTELAAAARADIADARTALRADAMFTTVPLPWLLGGF